MTWRTELRSLLDIIIGNFSLVFTGKVLCYLSRLLADESRSSCVQFGARSSIGGFSEDQQSVNIRPILNLIKRKRIIMQDAISRSRGNSAYGDDFTLMCMCSDSIETHHFRHPVLAYACSFAGSHA